LGCSISRLGDDGRVRLTDRTAAEKSQNENR